MSYKGTYQIQNKDKFIGNTLDYRSFWERAVMQWCDGNPHIVRWGFECVTVKYPNTVEHRIANYIIDFLIIHKDGSELLVEIKPKAETIEPVNPGKRSTRYINQCKKFAINSEKWKAANMLAEANGGKFVVWTEDELAQLGILAPGVSGSSMKSQVYKEARARRAGIEERKKRTTPASVNTRRVPNSVKPRRKKNG